MSDNAMRFTGAAARGTAMVIITVRLEGDAFVLCEEASARLVMEDRGQLEMRQFGEDLAAFVDRTGVDKILLRGAPARGDYAAHPRIYKMEASLQLHPKLQIAMVTPATLDKWERHSGSIAPDVHPSVTTMIEKTLHRDAIRAACLSAMGWPQPSWCEHVPSYRANEGDRS